MDELSQAQIEEIARQGRYLSKWLEDNSTLDTTRLAYAALAASDVSSAAIRAMDSMAIASEALISHVLIAEAAINLQTEMLKGINTDLFRGINLEPFRGINLEPFRGLALDAVFRELEPAAERTAAIIRDALNTPIDGILRYQSTLAELSSSVIGLHRVFEDVGTSFTIALDREITDERTVHRASFELAAGKYGVDSSNFQVDKETETGTPTSAKENSELDDNPTAQIIQLSTLEANTSLGPLQVVGTSQCWSYTRSESTEGLHQFNFCGVGGDEVRRKVNFIADFTHWVMSRDESAIERIMSALLFRSDISAVDLIPLEVDQTAPGIRAKRLGINTDRLLRWDKIRLEYFPQGLTQARIAEKESVSTVAIRNDFRDMRKHGLLPRAKNSTP